MTFPCFARVKHCRNILRQFYVSWSWGEIGRADSSIHHGSRLAVLMRLTGDSGSFSVNATISWCGKFATEVTGVYGIFGRNEETIESEVEALIETKWDDRFSHLRSFYGICHFCLLLKLSLIPVGTLICRLQTLTGLKGQYVNAYVIFKPKDRDWIYFDVDLFFVNLNSALLFKNWHKHDAFLVFVSQSCFKVDSNHDASLTC